MNSTAPSSTLVTFNDIVNAVTATVYPITVTVTMITNMINICVLSRRALRSSSCTHYFLASVLGSIVYLIGGPLNTTLRLRNVVAIILSPVGCKILMFTIYTSSLFTALMLVSASVDRVLISSSSVFLRSLSKVHVARRSIIVVSILTFLYMSPHFFVYSFNTQTNQCGASSTTLASVYIASRVVLFYILSPLLMIVFGTLAIYNIRKQANRITPVGQLNRRRHRRRTEGQLTRMLFIQVGAYIIFTVPSGVTYTMVTFVPNMNTPFLSGLRTITIIWQQGFFFLSFFLYIVSAKIYRQQMKKLFKCGGLRGRIVLSGTQTVDLRGGKNQRTTNRRA